LITILLLCIDSCAYLLFLYFFYTATSSTVIYTLSLHDALPICFTVWSQKSKTGPKFFSPVWSRLKITVWSSQSSVQAHVLIISLDRKSTRLNSSHLGISYAVFCLKKKKKPIKPQTLTLTQSFLH